DVDSAVAFSHDGRRFAFLRGVPATNEVRVMVAPVGAPDRPARLAARPLSAGAYPLYSRLAWSPDDHPIALPVRGAPFDEAEVAWVTTATTTIVGIDTTSGQERLLTPKRWDAVGGLDWLNQETVIVSATESGKPNHQIWRVDLTDGSLRRVTNDLSAYRDVSVASAGAANGADGATIATGMGDVASSISVLSKNDLNVRTAATSGNGRYDGQGGMAWTPDGRLV